MWQVKLAILGISRHSDFKMWCYVIGQLRVAERRLRLGELSCGWLGTDSALGALSR